MLDHLRAQQPAIAVLCRRYAVMRLEIFGSAATGTFGPARSDLDFLVAFAPHPSLSRFEQYVGLQEELQALFGRPVDLVTVDALRNPCFIRSVNASRRLLCATWDAVETGSLPAGVTPACFPAFVLRTSYFSTSHLRLTAPPPGAMIAASRAMPLTARASRGG